MWQKVGAHRFRMVCPGGPAGDRREETVRDLTGREPRRMPGGWRGSAIGNRG
jgi:hypothetical protein